MTLNLEINKITRSSFQLMDYFNPCHATVLIAASTIVMAINSRFLRVEK